MIKKGKVRFTISMSKQQNEFLEKVAKNLSITKSKAISWLISKNIANLISNYKSEEELQTLIEIARSPWIHTDDDDDE